MENVRTVSDTKRAFYSQHTRPVNSIYRRVVEELMVEMHLLSVNVDFRYDPIYALGVVTTFDRFMQGYWPERDRESIFNALCQAIGDEPQRYRQDAERLVAMATQVSTEQLTNWLTLQSDLPTVDHLGDLRNQPQVIAENSHFKYSRLFGVGLFTLVEITDADLVKDPQRSQEILQPICEALHLSLDKLQKDLELYRSNLEKMTQAQAMMREIVEADRKKREQRSQQGQTETMEDKTEDKIASPPSSSQESA